MAVICDDVRAVGTEGDVMLRITRGTPGHHLETGTRLLLPYPANIDYHHILKPHATVSVLIRRFALSWRVNQSGCIVTCL